MESDMFDLCIIGGGASAMAAAVAYGKCAPDAAVCILEKKEILGKKLAATGNGKCNLSHIACDGLEEVLDFFHELGILTRTDEAGRIYPYSEQARDVVTALEQRLRALSVEVVTSCRVQEIRRKDGWFEILAETTDQGEQGRKRLKKWSAGRVLLASGGKSAPQFGTTGDGYRLASALGHTIKRLAPVLTAVQCDGLSGREKGARMKGAVSLEKDHGILLTETGELQFTEDGLSGICIFNLSRLIKSEAGEPFQAALKRYAILVDFFPQMEKVQLERILRERLCNGWDAPESVLLSLVPKRLVQAIWDAALSFKSSMGNRQRDDAGDETAVQNPVQTEDLSVFLAQVLKAWRLPVTGVKGWKDAQCTSGGVDLCEVDLRTMESKLVPNLFFAGEVLDYDGPCGGYNLHHAWETGIRAGRAAAYGR